MAHTHFPNPCKEKEKKAVGHGPVTSYFLSPEELEEVRRKYPNPSIEKRPSRPIEIPRKAKKIAKPHKKGKLTKEFVLAEFAKGKTSAQIEKENGMKRNTLSYHLRKWNIQSPHGIIKRKERVEQ